MPLHPTRALAEIRSVLPDDSVVTLDTGNACLQAADRLSFGRCPGLMTPLDFGLVGFGYAAALGACVASGESPGGVGDWGWRLRFCAGGGADGGALWSRRGRGRAG